MVCMVEVKRDDFSADIAERQMTEYMQRVFERSFYNDFRGYLVLGWRVVVFGRNPYLPQGVNIVDILDRFFILAHNDPFTRALSRISVNNWNNE